MIMISSYSIQTAPRVLLQPSGELVITSPSQNQRIFSDSFPVHGRSLVDDLPGDCRVNILVNGMELFRPASAVGPGGVNDYSTWQLTLTSYNRDRKSVV